MKLHISFTFVAFLLGITIAHAQLPNPALIGFWHNWNDANAPYIQLDAIDERYNVVEIAFAVPTSPSDMTMIFTPEVASQNELTTKIQTLQSQNKKVLLSIGGATSTIDLSTTLNKDAFVYSMSEIINQYGFDGIDIDIESGNSILNVGGTIAAPSNIAQINLIDAVKEIMANYRLTHPQKLLLTLSPETAYAQGGQSAFSGIWGGYLPIIDGLRDSLDVVQVQLYNSGTMYGIDDNIYAQGTADFIVAMTEAMIQGFTTAGGMFNGLPPEKVAVALPACTSAAGGGYVDSETLVAAMEYLTGSGPQPGTYTLTNAGGYPTLGGMMTWSINWDAVASCGIVYEYAEVFEEIFGPTSSVSLLEPTRAEIYPNPTNGQFTIALEEEQATIRVFNMHGQQIIERRATQKTTRLQIDQAGVYLVCVTTSGETFTHKVVVGD
jgi:chitinase